MVGGVPEVSQEPDRPGIPRARRRKQFRRRAFFRRKVRPEMFTGTRTPILTPQMVDEVRRLLAEKKQSQRAVARLTGVSRGTVGRIAHGEKLQCEDPIWRKRQGADFPSGPLRRCPTCGGRVYMPCRLCRVRDHATRTACTPKSQRDVAGDNPGRLQLRAAEQRRYEALHARKVHEAIEFGEPRDELFESADDG